MLIWPPYMHPTAMGFGVKVGIMVKNNSVQVAGGLFQLDCDIAPYPEGTQLAVHFGAYGAWVELHADYEAERQAAEIARKAEKQRRAELVIAQARAAALNAKTVNENLKIPVRWTVGQKSVLSGLSESSWGDGRNRRSVDHVLLLEDLVDGKFVRTAHSFLCTTESGSNGKQYSHLESFAMGNAEAGVAPYVPAVTCKQCLARAQRWANAPEGIDRKSVV